MSAHSTMQIPQEKLFVFDEILHTKLCWCPSPQHDTTQPDVIIDPTSIGSHQKYRKTFHSAFNDEFWFLSFTPNQFDWFPCFSLSFQFTELLYPKKTFEKHSTKIASKWKPLNSFREFFPSRYFRSSTSVNENKPFFYRLISTARTVKWPYFSSVRWMKPSWHWWKCTTFNFPTRIIYVSVFPNQTSRHRSRTDK